VSLMVGGQSITLFVPRYNEDPFLAVQMCTRVQAGKNNMYVTPPLEQVSVDKEEGKKT
jgi:hypothetical protein